jgi:hypothetical protein
MHEDSDSSSEFIFHHIDPDAKICGPDLSDSCINSDDGQVSGNIGGNDGGGCGYDDKEE